uniref:NADH dehydrogenase subunit 6 n=1 Tax=Margattea limbata TaxID=3037043 RepID=UPI0027AAC1A9|nr:NADH dehydrogenase subunit 6 [Margattea limbata]WGO57766.1 NADH dehydrogenase subunit 6 [Margattea limbata]
MNMLITITMITLPTLLTYSKHPLIMGLILLMQTILISVLTGMLSQTFWFSYILFIIFLGGMLVLFIYVTSLASNEIIMFSLKWLIILLFISMSMFMLMNNLELLLFNQESLPFTKINNSSYEPLIKLFNMPLNLMIILLGTYLFLSLIAVVKITNLNNGPLRQMT